jgi:hypothetical protein
MNVIGGVVLESTGRGPVEVADLAVDAPERGRGKRSVVMQITVVT